MSVIAIYKEMFSLTERDVNIKNPIIAHAAPFIAVVLYLLMCRYLPKYLVKRQGLSNGGEDENVIRKTNPVTPRNGGKKVLTKLDWVIFAHNFVVWILSVLGSIFAIFFSYLPYLFRLGLRGTICDKDGIIPTTPDPINMWAFIFVWLKFVELFDTFYLIVKKPQRKVAFLHWYHHATVLIYTYYSLYYEISVGYVFAVMNFVVHAIMYYYYAAVTLGYKPSWGFYLTILQIVQMFAGIFFISLFSVYYFGGGECQSNGNPIFFIIYAYLMYGSYLFLFIRFFVKRYYSKGKTAPKPEDPDVESKV